MKYIILILSFSVLTVTLIDYESPKIYLVQADTDSQSDLLSFDNNIIAIDNHALFQNKTRYSKEIYKNILIEKIDFTFSSVRAPPLYAA